MCAYHVFSIFYATSIVNHLHYFASIRQILMFIKHLLINVQDIDLDVGGGKDGWFNMKGLKQLPKNYVAN